MCLKVGFAKVEFTNVVYQPIIISLDKTVIKN